MVSFTMIELQNKQEYFDLIVPKYISWEFYKQYIDIEPNFGKLGLIVFLRTYSRFIEKLNRREKWCEVVLRVVEFSLDLDTVTPIDRKKREARTLFKNIFELKVFPAGRTLYTGTPNNKNGTTQFNCSYLNIDSLDSYVEMLYLLQVGAGVGFSVEQKHISKLPKFNTKIKVIHKEQIPKLKSDRLEDTQITYNKTETIGLSKRFLLTDSDRCDLPNGLKGNVSIEIGDSKEGFCTALKAFLILMTKSTIKQIEFVYDSVRAEGERLKTFGGRAAGYRPYKLMIRKVYWRILNCEGELDSVAAMDISNFIAEQVRVAGIRRASLISLGDSTDYNFIDAKKELWNYTYKSNWNEDVETDNLIDELKLQGYDLWSLESKAVKLYSQIDKKYPQYRYQESRVLSNNSVMLYEKPSTEYMNEIMKTISLSGEPGFINVETALTRRSDFEGLNPCAEILLRSRGVCNLTTVNIFFYIENDQLNLEALAVGIKLAVRMASRITNVDMWHPDWDKVQKEDRLLGVSFTGIGDTITSLNWSLGDLKKFFKFAQDVARTEADRYHEYLEIPKAKLALTIKPEGSISQLPTVSSGIHLGYAPLVQRSIRISSTDPLAKVLYDLKVEIVPENGSLDLESADTWILKFPVKYPTNIKSVDESVLDQLERYKCSMDNYTEHNTSITVSVAEDEWNQVTEWLLNDNNWKSFVGCAFLPKFDCSEGDDGTIPNLPYATITQESFDTLESSTPKLTEEELIVYISKFENQEEEFDVGSDCTTGGCSVR